MAGERIFMLRALNSRNYRLFFSGQLISLVGTWMTNTALSWLVYRLTGSAWALGVVGFAGQIPSFMATPFAGIFVDRWNRRAILVVTQIFSMAQSLALAVLTLTHSIDMPAIIALSLTQGIINAFDMPCRQAFVLEMIDRKEDLVNAIALNSSMVNVARLLGPSIGGLVIAAVGEGWCFLIDGVSYLAVIAALLAMRLHPFERRHADLGVLAQLKEGWNYLTGSAAIRSILLLLAFVCLVGFPYTILIPVFAAKVLRGGPHTLGFLMAASGCGALIGATWLASRSTVLGLGRTIPLAVCMFGAALTGFSLSRSVWLSLVLITAAGMGFMVLIGSSNTILQTIVDDDKRGRIMSFFTMSFMGTVPFGSLLVGSLAQKIGAPSALLLGGSLCLAAALWFYLHLPKLRAAVRPIYVRMGLLPPA